MSTFGLPVGRRACAVGGVAYGGRNVSQEMIEETAEERRVLLELLKWKDGGRMSAGRCGRI